MIAICNGLGAAMGALAEVTVAKNRRWIPKGMEVSYAAKATSDITCIAETDAAARTGDDPDLPVRIRGVRDDGTVVVEGVIRLGHREADADVELLDTTKKIVASWLTRQRPRAPWTLLPRAVRRRVRRAGARSRPRGGRARS